MTFTEQVWRATARIHEATLAHPFNRELAAGTLPRETFAYYLQQDALYLVDYCRALALTGARSGPPGLVLRFLEFARTAVVVERGMHEEFFRDHGVSAAVEPAPACFAYTNYLVATAAHRSYEEAVAALLPCFWTYREVGLSVHAAATADNPYRRWIDTYAGEEFGQATADAVAITDLVAAAATDAVRTRMASAYETSARLEWMFWDGAYRREEWPPR
ncbi:MAG: TenA family protein [Candidatus Krumholzibacteriia bacterium]